MVKRWRSRKAPLQLWHKKDDTVAVQRPYVSVIIPAMNESATIARVIREAAQVHRDTEIIVVANGCSDHTARIARASGARVLTFRTPLGHDVGRSVGAGAARGEVLLFIDGDMVIPSQDLRRFVEAVTTGVDVALNDYEGPVERQPVHRVILAKHVLNIALGRPELAGASMTAVPHALSRKALEIITAPALSVPPRAQAAAMMSGLQVQRVHRVEVGRMNPRRVQGRDPLEALVLSDHLEALQRLLRSKGCRGGFPASLDAAAIEDKARTEVVT
ncbi:glycosyltransferase family 2 protein [Paenibacillus sp. JSM ZJ436]|uniref:glycosyltransferase family 2 protein n=1 Tax=Paenibacillus sp. JSM ZJ436 TaxID=3376190 RepID=UPI00378EC34D